VERTGAREKNAVIVRIRNKLNHVICYLDIKRARTLNVVISALVFLGLAYSIMLGNGLSYLDEKEYYAIARNLVTQGSYSLDGLHPTAYRPPGYPFLLSFLILLGSNVVALRVFNFICYAGSIFCLQKLIRFRVDPTAGTISTIAPLLYPVLFYTAGTLYPQIVASFLFLTFVALIFWSDQTSGRRALLAGLVMGCLILTVPSFVAVLFATLVFFLLRRKGGKMTMVILLSTAATLAPWAVRNYLAFGEFIPFATNSGVNLFVGNSQKTTGNSGVNVDLSAYDAQTTHMSEIQKDAYYRSLAIDFIKKDKGRAILLYFEKLLNNFNFRNELANKGEASNFKDFIMFLTYYPILLIALARFMFWKKYPLHEIEKYFATVYVSNALFQAIFFTRIRFRLPFDFVLIGIAAIFISRILHDLGAFGTRSVGQHDKGSLVERNFSK
jgi:hypothetical protein